MSVRKDKRKESKFNVLINMIKLRKAVLDLCKRKFGYSEKGALRRLKKQFGGMDREDLTDDGKIHWDKEYDLIQEELTWHIPRQRDSIEALVRSAHLHLIKANSIYPRSSAEAIERRLNQCKAIADLETAILELQFTLYLFPISIGEFDNIMNLFDAEIELIKRWRKADNKVSNGLALKCLDDQFRQCQQQRQCEQ